MQTAAADETTGGKQMDGFSELVAAVAVKNGMPSASIYTASDLEIPGYFRPTKRWDMLVVDNGRLVAALEFKSHRGPSFGNNFNNRTEEALGNAMDLWTAYREGAFGAAPPAPWLGWVMMLEDCGGSTRPTVSSREKRTQGGPRSTSGFDQPSAGRSRGSRRTSRALRVICMAGPSALSFWPACATRNGSTRSTP